MRKSVARSTLGLLPLCAFVLCFSVTTKGSGPATSQSTNAQAHHHGAVMFLEDGRSSSRILTDAALSVVVGGSDSTIGAGQGGLPTPSSTCGWQRQICITFCNSSYIGDTWWDGIQRTLCRTGCDAAYLWCLIWR